MNPDPSKPRAEVAEMQALAAVCQAVDGGIEEMRKAGKTYLPKFRNEEEDDWLARLASTTFFPALAKALDTMVGKPFGEPIVLDGPSQVLAHAENIDMAGRDLDTFARDIARAALRDGITWVLVDYPPVPPQPNLAAERALGVRPYWVHIPLANILGWKTRTVGGKPVLAQVRFLESVEVEDGPFDVASKTRVRVLEPGQVQVWEQAGERKAWTMVEEYPVSLQEIPLVAVYTGRKGFWTAKPPLSDLAHLNVTHWQSSSDQRNILHKARVPFLAADRDTRPDTDAEVTFKAGIFTGFENLHAVSFDAEPIAAGRQDLLDIEDQMRRVAGELLSRQAGDKSATEAGLEAQEGGAWLKAKMRTVQDALEECFRLHCAWMAEAGPVSVALNMDWDEEQLGADVLQQMTTARQAGLISQETYTHNVARAGLLPDGRTVDQEVAAIEAEGPVSMTPKTTPTAQE